METTQIRLLLERLLFFEPTIEECPANWQPLGEAEGRFIISGYDASGVVVSIAAPLSSGEDRLHSHGLTIGITTTDVSYAGIDGCCNSNTAANGFFDSTTNTTEISSGLPYIQLLTCVSQETTFNSSFPAGILLFNEISCPPNYNITYESSGRFIVGLPDNGIPGATFGSDSLPPGFTGNLEHDHTFEGSLALGSTGVGLASGCCGSGYAAASTYDYQGSTTDDAVDLPYIMIPLCAQL